jgi:hypothetical protein
MRKAMIGAFAGALVGLLLSALACLLVVTQRPSVTNCEMWIILAAYAIGPFALTGAVIGATGALVEAIHSTKVKQDPKD